MVEWFHCSSPAPFNGVSYVPSPAETEHTYFNYMSSLEIAKWSDGCLVRVKCILKTVTHVISKCATYLMYFNSIVSLASRTVFLLHLTRCAVCMLHFVLPLLSSEVFLLYAAAVLRLTVLQQAFLLLWCLLGRAGLFFFCSWFDGVEPPEASTMWIDALTAVVHKGQAVCCLGDNRESWLLHLIRILA